MDADTYNDEMRSARAHMTEMDRAQNCGHTIRPHGTCRHCGDTIDKGEA